jgi:hypothetical protein
VLSHKSQGFAKKYASMKETTWACMKLKKINLRSGGLLSNDTNECGRAICRVSLPIEKWEQWFRKNKKTSGGIH